MSLRWQGRAWGERAAWATLLLLNAVTHFLALGARAMSHDESMHAFYSYELAQKGVYHHDPMMHGPLLFHLNALVFLLLGTGDGVARLVPALAGLALVASSFLLRRYLGRAGALMAATLLTLSPTVLFYGRYLVTDVYLLAFAVVWLFSLFRYLESGRRRWLYGMVAAMALSFSAKETTFLFGPIVGVSLVALAVARRLRRKERWEESRAGELALLMLSLVLPFAAPLGYLALAWNPADFSSPEAARRAVAMVGLMVLLSTLMAAFGLRGRRASGSGLTFGAWARLMALFWSAQIVLFTTFFTNPRGLVTGIVGSVGYWLGQHHVARGSQPWFYYLLLGVMYELLPLLLSAAAAFSLLRGASAETGRRRRFLFFTLWWAAGSWLSYSIAGEKMPWLMVHIVLPMCLLGGWWLGRLVSGIHWTSLEPRPALLAVAAVPACVLILAPLSWIVPFRGRDIESLSSSGRWLFHLLAGGLLLFWIVRSLRHLPTTVARRLLVLGAICFLGVLTLRFSLMASFVNEDLATELLVYAHATPDIKRAMREIEEVAARTGAGDQLEVAFDDDSTWPLTWYLRVYPKQRFYGDTPTPEAMSAPVVLVGSKNLEKAAPYLERDYVRRDYRLVWWPIEDYAAMGGRDLWNRLRNPLERDRLRQIVFHRRYPGVDLAQWPYRHEFKLYVRRDLAARAWPLGLSTAREGASAGAPQFVPELRCEPLAVYSGPYDGQPLQGPVAVAVTGEGDRLIADTGNHRIVVLDRSGSLKRAFGSRCDLGQGAQGGCLDPDGAGPLRPGDGQFLEPSGIAAGPDGEVVVADTWNGRIQVFDREGRFLRGWGHLSLGGPAPVPPDALYGPRAVAFDRKGDRIVVVDTGNKRLLLFGRDGRFLRELGGGGATPGRFEEPVGVAIAEDGSISVADTWNRRIQRFDVDLAPVGEWRVPGWESRDVFNKPYLGADEAGSLYASDPGNGRLFVFAPDGRLALSLVGLGWHGATRARPSGVALDDRGQALLVADPAGHRVWALPQVQSASSGCPSGR